MGVFCPCAGCNILIAIVPAVNIAASRRLIIGFLPDANHAHIAREHGRATPQIRKATRLSKIAMIPARLCARPTVPISSLASRRPLRAAAIGPEPGPRALETLQSVVDAFVDPDRGVDRALPIRQHRGSLRFIRTGHRGHLRPHPTCDAVPSLVQYVRCFMAGHRPSGYRAIRSKGHANMCT